MSVRITGEYIGNKKVVSTHTPSGSRLTTVAPVDNQGDGSTFSPTDLIAVGLGACMITVIAIVAERRQLDISGMRYEAAKNMGKDPRRIDAITIKIWLPGNLDNASRKRLIAAAHTCPVHKSLHPDVTIPVEFIFT